MRKITILCILILFLNISIVNAVPSDPNSVSILTQPDGTTFKARMVGDERQSHWELLDGRPIEMDLNDYWVYKGTNYKVMINIYPSTSPAPNENTTTAKIITIQPNINVPKILPDDYLYPIKLFFEDFNEAFTFNDAKKLTLKQEHLQNRFTELEYEVRFNSNKNTEKLLQKIQIKQLEVEESVDNLEKSCTKPCYVIKKLGDIEISQKLERSDDFQKYKSHNQEVLTRLLNSPDMPEQSRKGLQNALNNTMKTKVTANMVQGTYTVSQKYSSMLPFESAMVYDPTDNKWYSIVVRGDKISITTAPAENPDYYIYPTSSQMSTLEDIGRDINNNGLTTKNKIKMLKLWYQITKTEVK